MLSVDNVLLRSAVSLLPASEQPRFDQEWGADLEVLRRVEGQSAATRFAAQTLAAAPRMTMALREHSASAYVELSLASLLSVFPAVVLGIMAIVFQSWVMLLAQLGNVTGMVLIAHGFWRNDGRLLDSKRPRIGLLLVVISSGTGIAVVRLTDFGLQLDERINAAIPNMIIVFGMALLASSNYLGRFRRRVQLAAVTVLAPGAMLAVVVAFVNAAAASGVQRFSVMLWVIPSAALAWACYSIVDRPQVFREDSVEAQPEFREI